MIFIFVFLVHFELCELVWYLCDWCLYKCFSPFPQCQSKYKWLLINAATLCLISERSQQQLNAHFLTILLFVCLCACVWLRIRACVCVSSWICISDCSMRLWPLAIQPLLILNCVSSPQSNLASMPPSITSTTPYWHPVVTGGTTSTWCLAGSRGDGELFTSGICP